MMNKPCFHNSDKYPEPCIAEEGNCVSAESWGECLKGRAGKNYKEYLKSKLARASKTSKEIADWAKNSKVQPYEPAFRGQITKIIMKIPSRG